MSALAPMGWDGKYERVRIIIGQARGTELLDRFLQAVGMTHYRVRGPRYHNPNRDQKLPIYDFQIARQGDVHLVCWLLWPWLGSHKRHQFEEAFAKFHAMGRERRGDAA